MRIALIVCLLAGCYSKSAGEKLAREAQDREARLQQLESGMEGQRTQMRAALESAEAKVRELEQVLERATEVVTRNSADLGTEVGQLRQQLQAMEGTVAELRNELQGTQQALAQQQTTLDQRINQMARRAGVDLSLDESQIPSERNEHFTAAQTALRQGEHSKARALFRAYVQRYSDDDRADDAQHAIGKSYLEQRQPARALSEFRRVVSNYRSGDIFDQTLFDMAEAFYQLHACTDARSALEALIQRASRRSALGRQARTKLRQVRSAPRGYCTS
ncbi:MAG: tetratricopeptide repeat protein [Myxococcota bacterium]